MLHVRELVREHAFQFFFAEDLQNALGRRDRRVIRIPSRRKGVRCRLRDDIAARLRETGPRRKPADDAVERVIGADLFRAVHLEDNLVREPIRHEVRHDGEQEADHQSLRSTERFANEEQERTERAEKKRRLHNVGHISIV